MRKRSSIVGLSVILSSMPFVGLTESAQADPPSFLSMFRKRSDTTSVYKLKAEHGPWLILLRRCPETMPRRRQMRSLGNCTTTSKWTATFSTKTFDHSSMLKTDRHQSVDINGTVETRRVRLANQSSEKVCAVLVGSFASLEDPKIEALLQQIRTAQPAALTHKAAAETKDPSKAESSNWLVSSYRRVMWSQTDRKENLAKGPMGAAFVTRNPLLPADFFEAPKLDEFVTELNKAVEHSLLECPKRYTVRVATFQGNAVTDFGNGGVASQPKSLSAKLDDAADKANQLTLALRAEGVEAYQFHDRFASYVTIGGFDDLGTELPGGEFQMNPQIKQILDERCGYRVLDAKDPKTMQMTKVQSLKSLNKIPFDIEGKPMAVPRAGTSKLYGGSLIGRKAIQ